MSADTYTYAKIRYAGYAPPRYRRRYGIDTWRDAAGSVDATGYADTLP